MNFSRTLAAASLAMVALAIAGAEPIKVIVPTAPGGGTDGFFRVVVKEAAPYFSDPIVVVNVPGRRRHDRRGADGQCARRRPHARRGMARSRHREPAYDEGAVHARTTTFPVVQLSSAPYVMCVQNDFPANDGKGLIEAFRKNPDKYTYGNDGAGGPGQLATARILRATNTSARDIPFKGAGETLTAFLGGHIDVYVGSIPPILQHMKSGKAKCLLVTSADRVAALPNVAEPARSRHPGRGDDSVARDSGARRARLRKTSPRSRAPSRRRPTARRRASSWRTPARKCSSRKGPALRESINREYDALGKVAKSLNLSPQ